MEKFCNKIFNEDCIATIERMMNNDFKVDMILTSPPYNMTSRPGGYADTGRYDVYTDWMSEENYIEWTVSLFNSFNNILKENRTIAYNFSYSIENPALPYKLVSEIVKRTPFTVLDTIVWKKRSGIPFPANGKRLSRNWEFVFIFVRKSEIKTYENNRKVVSTSASGQNYYEVSYNLIEAPNNDGKCPYNQATYSSELCLGIMDIYAKPGWVVYDPFMGSGTTGVACLKRGDLRYVGSEISENQCNYAKERIEKEKI